MWAIPDVARGVMRCVQRQLTWEMGFSRLILGVTGQAVVAPAIFITIINLPTHFRVLTTQHRMALPVLATPATYPTPLQRVAYLPMHHPPGRTLALPLQDPAQEPTPATLAPATNTKPIQTIRV